MLKRALLVSVIIVAGIGHVFAQVDVNKADMAALDGIKGVGPTTSKAILAERKKGGDFSDWADFERRVKGISARRSERLSSGGLTVNGEPRSKTSSVKK
jgi:competence protein ComEA